MTKKELIHELTIMKNAARFHRKRLCQLTLEHPSIIPHLLDICLDSESKLSFRAAWTLEFVLKKDLSSLYPLLNKFCANINQVNCHSTRRSMAKICEILAIDFDSKNRSSKDVLTKKQKEYIITNCFDWKIQNEKVAVEAYSMNTLYIFGKEQKWIHEELTHILKDNMEFKSCGYKVRAKKILKWIHC